MRENSFESWPYLVPDKSLHNLESPSKFGRIAFFFFKRDYTYGAPSLMKQTPVSFKIVLTESRRRAVTWTVDL